MSQSIKISLVSLCLLTVHQIVLNSQFQQVCNKVVKYMTQQSNICIIIVCIIVLIIYLRIGAYFKCNKVYWYSFDCSECMFALINDVQNSKDVSKLNQNGIIQYMN